jgi:hypothetical protein
MRVRAIRRFLCALQPAVSVASLWDLPEADAYRRVFGSLRWRRGSGSPGLTGIRISVRPVDLIIPRRGFESRPPHRPYFLGPRKALRLRIVGRTYAQGVTAEYSTPAVHACLVYLSIG